MTRLKELAQAGIDLLDLQQRYFKAEPRTAQKAELVKESKQAERDFRRLCRAALESEATSSLFEEERGAY